VPFTYPFPRPAVACDIVAFSVRGTELLVLLVQRKDAPFKGHWALPGGFVNENEALERAALRELSEETGLSGIRLEQLGAFGDPSRDPRGHTVSIVHLTFFLTEGKLAPGDDAADAQWHAFRSLALGKTSSSGGAKRVRLAFDHADILARAHARLLKHLEDPVRDPPAFDLLPPRFTLAELRHAYEVISGRTLAPAKFRRQLVERGLVVPASSRPTKKVSEQLYRWNRLR